MHVHHFRCVSTPFYIMVNTPKSECEMKQSLSHFRKFLHEENCVFEENTDLKKVTRINTEARASLLVKPRSIDEFKKVLCYAIDLKIQFDIFGDLTNVYLSNKYRAQLVVLTTGMRQVTHLEKQVVCESGVRLSKVSRDLSKLGIEGFEGLVGIPGTVGAAAINNSGSLLSAMSNVVDSVEVFTPEKRLFILSNADMNYGVRSSAVKTGEIQGYILRVFLNTSRRSSPEQVMKRVSSYNEYRVQVTDGPRKSLGSVFVSTGLRHITSRYRIRLFCKKMIFGVTKNFVRNRDRKKALSTYLFFLFLGHPGIAKYCDGINRFCWEEDTKEENFYEYIEVMRKLSRDRIKLEVEIK